jgi:DNA-binding transcriptional MerR regulator
MAHGDGGALLPVLWTQLALTPTQVAALCGVRVRQVTYWAQQGYIAPAPGRDDRYNGDAVDLCVLIKQALRAGLPLHQAVSLAQADVVEDLTDQIAHEGADPTRLSAVVAALREARASVGAILTALDQVAPDEAERQS